MLEVGSKKEPTAIAGDFRLNNRSPAHHRASVCQKGTLQLCSLLQGVVTVFASLQLLGMEVHAFACILKDVLNQSRILVLTEVLTPIVYKRFEQLR